MMMGDGLTKFYAELGAFYWPLFLHPLGKWDFPFTRVARVSESTYECETLQ